MRLENWSITYRLYKSPEQGRNLIGDVYGHPTRPDGRCMYTSPIVKINSNIETIETRSGSSYELGKVGEKING